MLKGSGISPCMARNLIIGAMQAQVEYGLKNTSMNQMEEIQIKYNIANRRAIRALMRAPMYVTNEGIELELGVKKITDLFRKNVLNHIGKVYLDKEELHHELLQTAINYRT